MYIGAFSKLTGISRKAILHYEVLGLILEPRRKGRYRTYSEADADLICMIKRAQSLGFSLKEIADVVSARAKTRKLPVEMVNMLIDTKRKELRDIVNNALSKDKQLANLQADLLRNSANTNTNI
jgi:DNA-binding transcriptional MerR regulator